MRRTDRYQGFPSVTEILKSSGLVDFSMITQERLDHARARGEKIHEWTELLDHGYLKPEDLPDPWIAGYIRGYLAFKEDAGFEIAGIEEVVVSQTYRYAGTLDRRGYLRNLKYPDQETVLDIKAVAQVSHATRLQVVGYAIAADETARRDGRIPDDHLSRTSLQLRGDGTYRLARYDQDEGAIHDAHDWLACVRLHHFRARHDLAA